MKCYLLKGSVLLLLNVVLVSGISADDEILGRFQKRLSLRVRCNFYRKSMIVYLGGPGQQIQKTFLKIGGFNRWLLYSKREQLHQGRSINLRSLHQMTINFHLTLREITSHMTFNAFTPEEQVKTKRDSSIGSQLHLKSHSSQTLSLPDREKIQVGPQVRHLFRLLKTFFL